MTHKPAKVTTLFELQTDPESLLVLAISILEKAKKLKIARAEEQVETLIMLRQEVSNGADHASLEISGHSPWQASARRQLIKACVHCFHHVRLVTSSADYEVANKLLAWQELTRTEGYLDACEDSLRHRVDSAANVKAEQAQARAEGLVKAIEPYRSKGMGRTDAVRELLKDTKKAEVARSERIRNGEVAGEEPVKLSSESAVLESYRKLYRGEHAWKRGEVTWPNDLNVLAQAPR